MRLTILIVMLTARLGNAQGVGAPVAGLVLDPASQLIPVHGVSGTLLRGEPIPLPTGLTGMLVSASFSDTSGLLKSATTFVITDGSGHEQSSLPSSDSGAAMASFATDGSLQWFCAGDCTELQTPQGTTVSTSNTGGTAVALGIFAGQSVPVLTQSGTQLWASSLNVTDHSVSSQVPIPGGTPAVAFNGGWLTTSAAGLIWTGVNGTTAAIALPEAVASLQSSGARTASINGRWMVNSALQILEIPVKPHIAPNPRLAPVLVTR